MKLDSPTKPSSLAKYVRVDDEAQRLTRIWQNVSERTDTDASPSTWQHWFGWRGAWVLATALVLVLVGTKLVSPTTAPSALQGAALETASDALKVDLEDGSAL